MKKWVTLILAGGQSRRMGTSKTFIPHKEKIMIEYLVSISQKVSEYTMIISNENDKSKLKDLLTSYKNITILQDDPQFKGFGPLAGLYTGMKHCKADWYFVLANDMPDINIPYLNGLRQCTATHSQYEVIIPSHHERIHPLAGAYRNVKNELYSYLSSGNKKMTSFIDSLSSYYIQESEWSEWTNRQEPFFNMNTLSDLIEWQKRKEDD
ncbi:molybdenum cofactor guanylyltransferase [Chengkuizengella axinellae]|uniref:Probable molybdenum cofactor guanylyltransferase n=1 Tax=Chengkuizengella axinellae TaxID=3064388 RepID=A0ABT9J1V5_9BACL|nr:molybdenum cofactor guanylyltransferase [Chengkuizengella sp. 2205SS18-9]MDP5275601.1 molybdenum cofactor guanylyltransferase [Chengkuizengella sp. 2205SS18-9]